MDILSIIKHKRSGEALLKEELNFFVRGVTDGTIPDYQIASLLMAICCVGMSEQETVNLTLAMSASGEQLNLAALTPTVDKHSTGGVSDSTTFVVVPILALLGFRVAKMSGRALGFTGGTIDKLECFLGYQVEQTEENFFRIVNTVGASIISASRNLAPADKVLYALRDVTGTIDSIPLIASSVMSKKLASGAETIVLDVKFGDGAFMQDEALATELARLMVRIGTEAGRKVGAIVTSMAEPLGEYIGGNLECKGAIEVLNGKRNALYTVSKELIKCACAINGQIVTDAQIDKFIDSGEAYNKFVGIIQQHGGEIPATWETAPCVSQVVAKQSGHVTRIHTRDLGEVNLHIGGGRATKGAPVNHTVGIHLQKRIGDAVERGEVIATLYTQTKDENAVCEVARCFVIEEPAVAAPTLIVQRLYDI